MRLTFSNESFNGLLIVFCGIDGSGKTTQIDILAESLRKSQYNVFKTFQPTREMRESELFKTFVHGYEKDYENLEYRSLSLLTVSDRLQHSKRVILPELKKASCII